MKSFGEYLPHHQQTFTTAYSTKVLGYSNTFLSADIHVFTSPSNVEATLLNFPNHRFNTVIAWGESTEKAIKEHLNFHRMIVLEKPSFECLIKELRAI